MEDMKKLEFITDLEPLIFDNISLLEVAKGYCEFNQDKSNSIASVIAILDIILKNQKDIARMIDLIAI